MFINTKKVISTVLLSSFVLSGVILTPGVGLAKNKGNSENAKKNHGQEVSAQARAKHDDDDNKGKNNKFKLWGGFGLNLGRILPGGVISANSAALNTFKVEVKDAREEAKDAKKDAKTQLKADVKVATTDQQKQDAFKAYLQKVLDAFKAFANAKENALQNLINTLANAPAPTNQAPTANAQSVTLDENTAKVITLTGSDPQGSSLTFTVITNPVYGTLTGTAPNLTYNPHTNYNGSDSFTFRVNDGSLNSTIATVSITINGSNQAPTANAQTVQATKNTAKAITLTGSDPEVSPLTFTVLTSTNHGVLSGSAPNLSYLPAIDFTGTDQFTFWVNDGSLNSASATVNINVINP